VAAKNKEQCKGKLTGIYYCFLCPLRHSAPAHDTAVSGHAQNARQHNRLVVIIHL